MPLVWIVPVLVLVTGTWLSIQSDHATSSAELAEVNTLTGNLLLYRFSLAECTHANPGFIGLSADSALDLPAWLRKPVWFQGYITAGINYAFIAPPPTGLVVAMDIGTESDLIGVRCDGQLATRRLGVAVVTLPVPIPGGAVVAVK